MTFDGKGNYAIAGTEIDTKRQQWGAGFGQSYGYL